MLGSVRFWKRKYSSGYWIEWVPPVCEFYSSTVWFLDFRSRSSLKQK